MRTPGPPSVDAEGIARTALAALSAAFHTRNCEFLIQQFSSDPGATYAGSEVGEIATGRKQLVELFSQLLSRPERYRFEFDDVRARCDGSTIWILADGLGHESGPRGEEQSFSYRVSGLLRGESESWRWALLCGAEPQSRTEANPAYRGHDADGPDHR